MQTFLTLIQVSSGITAILVNYFAIRNSYRSVPSRAEVGQKAANRKATAKRRR